jgi:cation diffusion facilitator CzcD-associated flavoprotein CzcO
VSHAIARFHFKIVTVFLYAFARKFPETSKRFLRATAQRYLPAGYDIDTHFKPRYNPWDQRLCIIIDGDFYGEIKQGRAEVVTDHIDHFDATGIVLTSGNRIDADVIVTATGLQLQALGGIELSIDGTEIKPTDRFVYKEYLLEDVPNMAWCIGYTNASWTLRADMTARAVARLLAYMESHGYTHAYPHLGDKPMQEKPAFDLQSGYVQRAPHALPKSGIRRPWKVRHNYVLDVIDHRFDRIEESMVFGHAHTPAVSA